MLWIVILQLLVTCVAGAGLFVLLRRTRSNDPVIAAIVTLGFLGRAFVGQVLFWISYLQLPIARGLQEGNGFWFYGGDSMSYFRNASAAAAGGLDRIINYQNVVPSPFWVQVLATFILLMGASAAVGLFLNCLAYATSCAIANWLAPQPTFLTRAAMAAFAFSPGGVLWGTQPLKDVFFYFLMFAFVGSAAAWRRTVPAERRPWVRAAAWTLIIAFVIYGISGIRWYMGLISFLAVAMFFAATVIWTKPRLVAMTMAVAGFILCGFAFFAGGRSDVPLWMREAVRPGAASLSTLAGAPKAAADSVVSARRGFDLTPGATMIRVPVKSAPESEPTVTAASSPASPREPTALPKTTPALVATTATVDTPAMAPAAETADPGEPASAAVAAADDTLRSDRDAVTQVAVTQVATQTGVAVTKPVAPRATGVPETSAVTPRGVPARESVIEPSAAEPVRTPAAPASEVLDTTTAESVAMAANPAEVVPAAVPTTPVRRTIRRATVTKKPAASAEQPAVVPPATPTAVEGVQAPVTETVVAATEVPAADHRPAAVLPKTHGQRLLAGIVAATIPRFVAQPLGLIEVQGGRGFWMLFDMATLMFMLCALLALAAIFFAVRKSVALRPLVLLTVPAALILGAALFYTVSNFGTLFRQREMVYVALLLIPFAVAAEQGRRRDQDRSPDSAPAEAIQG